MTVEERESVEELRARRAQVQMDIDFNKRMLEGRHGEFGCGLIGGEQCNGCNQKTGRV